MAKIEKIEKYKGGPDYQFYCPGCKEHHGVWTNKKEQPCWDFNGNIDLPTFSPSLLVREPSPSGMKICHSFIRDGKIQFLSDCTHHLAGQTIELPEIE